MEELSDFPTWVMALVQVGIVLASAIGAGFAYVSNKRARQKAASRLNEEIEVADFDTLLADQKGIAVGVASVAKSMVEGVDMLRVLEKRLVQLHGMIEAQINLDRHNPHQLITALRDLSGMIGEHYRRQTEEFERMHRLLQELAKRKGE